MNESKEENKQILHQDVYQRLRLRLKTLQQVGGQLEKDNLGYN